MTNPLKTGNPFANRAAASRHPLSGKTSEPPKAETPAPEPEVVNEDLPAEQSTAASDDQGQTDSAAENTDTDSDTAAETDSVADDTDDDAQDSAPDNTPAPEPVKETKRRTPARRATKKAPAKRAAKKSDPTKAADTDDALAGKTVEAINAHLLDLSPIEALRTLSTIAEQIEELRTTYNDFVVTIHRGRDGAFDGYKIIDGDVELD